MAAGLHMHTHVSLPCSYTRLRLRVGFVCGLMVDKAPQKGRNRPLGLRLYSHYNPRNRPLGLRLYSHYNPRIRPLGLRLHSHYNPLQPCRRRGPIAYTAPGL